MKTLLSFLVLGIPIYFFSLAYVSQARASDQVDATRLANCPSKPNCVCSECEAEDEHYISPIVLSTFEDIKTNEFIENTLVAMGAKITVNKPTYIAATFTSTIFRFVDDFEIRIDAMSKTIHVRSASRVGHSDFGVNRKRVEAFRRLIQKSQ